MAEIQGAKGGSSPKPATEAPDSLHSIAYARILDLVSEGQIQGFVSGSDAAALQDIYLDGTPIANADGSLNFKNIQVDSRSGTQDQNYIPGFSSVENEIAVGLELTSTTPWTQALSNTQLSAVRIRVSVPSLQKSDTSTGDIVGYSISYTIDLSTDGGSFSTVLNSALTGKTTSKYERTHRIDLPPATTGWTIRVTRTTANAHLATIADTTTIESYTEIIDAKLRYPNSALVGIIVDASQFQSIPTRAYHLKGRIVRVPSNYNPTTRAYTGTWDGTFQPAWTDNPAWVFFDLATNTRYGLGHLVPDALLDKWKLYAIAQYCDALVPDGNGGQEPRFTCNVYLQQAADAYKVLQDLATVFRGMVYWAGGAIQSVADMPGDPVYTYAAANVIDGKFTYQGSARKTRYTVALVSWNDPGDMYRAKVEYVEDRDGIARYGIQQTQVTAIGCASQGQAQRVGNWTLITSRLEGETVTFNVGLDGTIAAPGQIIRVQDPARAGKRQAGRISSATTTAVTVDAAPTVSVGDSLTVVLPTGVSETRTVSAVSGKTITASSAFSSTPQAESVWVVESSTLAAQTFRVISVTENTSNDALSFTITALKHVASKFDAIDNGTVIQLPPVTSIPPSTQPGPASVTLTSNETAGQVLASILLTIAWPATSDAVYYEVDWRKDNGDWRTPVRSSALAVDIRNAAPGTYVARVRAVNSAGVSSVPTVSNTFVVADQTKVPPALDPVVNSALTIGPKILNPNFDAGDVYWVKETGWAITGGKGVRTGNAGTPNAAIYNSVLVPVKLAQQVMVQCVLTASGADGTCGAAVRWFDASQAYISQSRGNTVTGTAGNTLSRITAAAPANAAYASAAAVAVSNTTGTYTADSFQLTLFPNNQDEVPDSATRGATSTTYLNANRPVINFGDTFHQNKNLDNIGDGAVYGRPNLNRLNAGRPTIDFSETIHANKNADNIDDGTLYARLPVANSTGTGTSRRALIDFTQGHAGKIIDNLGDGTYARTLATRVNAGRPTVDFSETIHANKTQDSIPGGNTFGRVPYSTSTNLLKNPTGAMGLTYWGAPISGNPVSAVLGSFGGGYYFVGTAGTADQGSMHDKVACAPNVVLTLSGDMYASNITGGTVQITIQFLDASNTEIAGTRQSITATNGQGWTRYSASYTTPTNTASVSVWMRASNLTGTGAPAWRRIKLELGSTATPFDDLGTQTGNRLAQAGSGDKMGDQRNLPASISQGYGGIRSATALTASSTGAVSVNAHTVTLGAAPPISYNAQSNAVTGLTQGTTYQIYTRDNYAGGSPTFTYTTSAATANSFDDVYIAGQVTIPTSGSSGGGGGGYCVVADMWLRTGLMAGQARWWHWLDCFDGFRRRRARVRGTPRITWAACVRIRTEHGAVLDCASSTPFTVQDGRVVMAPTLFGEFVLTDGGWERVVEVEGIGLLPVVRIHVGGLSYAAGRSPSHRIFSHNPIKP